MWSSASRGNLDAIIIKLLNPTNGKYTMTAKPETCNTIACQGDAVATFCNHTFTLLTTGLMDTQQVDNFTIAKKELAAFVGAVNDGCGKAGKGYCGAQWFDYWSFLIEGNPDGQDVFCNSTFLQRVE
ncbi:hypothetical protein HYALB_00001325 [Hymenoscyphus albidus]|uniref:Uncharacterized protein n=1 Tax=Hymenoscyphus albidus TaxID=595503 RepID=A0A9N9LCR8_9HELO|nr:hypothetical protein HYALB_00001325 [Hymenoscyphus albidus]